MSVPVRPRPLEPVTPDRPAAGLGAPRSTAVYRVNVEAAHLANPHLAVGRLLASEAGAFARVDGDDHHLRIEVVLPGAGGVADRDLARGWVHWAVHNAGVRGSVTEVG